MVVALAAAASQVGSQVASSLTGGLIKSSGTSARLSEIQNNYNLATQGNQDAVNQLAARAGYGPQGVVATGDGQAKDAARKALQSLLDAGIITGPPLPTGFVLTKYTVVSKATSADGKTADGGATGTSLQAVKAGMPTWGWILLALAAGFVVIKSGVLKKAGV